MKKKSRFPLGEYFAYNFFFDKDRELRFSLLKPATKTASSDVRQATGVIGRCNDGRSPVDSPSKKGNLFLIKSRKILPN